MTEVLIIGAGPAGLGAAEVLARAGARVTVLERQAEAGGVPRLCGHSPFGLREFYQLMGGATYARRLVAAARSAGARLLVGHSVVSIQAGVVRVATSGGEVTFTPDRILLATGAREASRAERLLPGERPLGVVTTGALQDLWFARGTLPFRRPVILGSELVAMSAILTCLQAGARPVAVVEQAAAMIARAPFRWLPRSLGIPVLTATGIEDLVASDGRLSEVVVRNAAVQVRGIECDGLVLTGAFRPESSLARLCGLAIDPATGGPVVDQFGRTSDPAIFAAGNLLRGIETAGRCWAEGRAIARAMLDEVGLNGEIEVRPGRGLLFVMPQRLRPGAKAALPDLQMRLERPVVATLTLTDAQGRRLASLQIASGPERRVVLRLADLDLRGAQGPLTVAVEEA